MNGARWLVQALEAEGVDTLFGYPGGAIMPFYDALHGASLKHVLVRHEQGADGRATGSASVARFVGPAGVRGEQGPEFPPAVRRNRPRPPRDGQ